MPQPSPAVPEAYQPYVDHAIGDLAKRLGVERGAITVLEARAVVWPDGSLGCPRPGMLYTQVQQEGLLIRLGHGGRAYAYHAGGGRMPELCESPAGGHTPLT